MFASTKTKRYMRNVHVLPTDKPSRLWATWKNALALNPSVFKLQDGQHVYITSDEEIKVGDWVLLNNNSVIKAQTVRKDSLWFNDGLETMPKYCKKIILTTDQDLINNGVQSIDDEFLEWFINNPSCENVEVVKDGAFRLDEFNQRCFYNQYKITIPSIFENGSEIQLSNLDIENIKKLN